MEKNWNVVKLKMEENKKWKLASCIAVTGRNKHILDSCRVVVC